MFLRCHILTQAFVCTTPMGCSYLVQCQAAFHLKRGEPPNHSTCTRESTEIRGRKQLPIALLFTQRRRHTDYRKVLPQKQTHTWIWDHQSEHFSSQWCGNLACDCLQQQWHSQAGTQSLLKRSNELCHRHEYVLNTFHHNTVHEKSNLSTAESASMVIVIDVHKESPMRGS